MTQRLGIAAALLGDPATLVLDEPVNGLDPDGILWIRNLLKDLAAQGRTVFVSSHLMSEMSLTAEHVVIIGKGRLTRRPADRGDARIGVPCVGAGAQPGRRSGWTAALGRAGRRDHPVGRGPARGHRTDRRSRSETAPWPSGSPCTS